MDIDKKLDAVGSSAIASKTQLRHTEVNNYMVQISHTTINVCILIFSLISRCSFRLCNFPSPFFLILIVKLNR